MTTRVLGVTLGVLACLAGRTTALAQAPGAINYVELFQMLDANDDRVIVRGEVPESGRAAFDRLLPLADTNKDGRIDQEEYRDLLMRARESAFSAAPRSAAQFDALDKNGDGKLGRDEFTGPPPLFARIDGDGDGFISKEEAIKFRNAADAGTLPGMNQFGPRFKAMDKNIDDKVSRDEFVGPPGYFDRIDTNHDGFLVPAEVRRFQAGNAPAAKKAQTPATSKDQAKAPE